MNWKVALNRLKCIYSSNQLNIILNTSHGVVAGRLDKFSKSDYEKRIILTGKKIIDIDSREILFEAWSERYLNNVNALVCKNLRENHGITLGQMGESIWHNRCSGINISSYENGTNLMPDSLFERIFESISSITVEPIENEEKNIRKKAKNFQLPEQKQIIQFRKVGSLKSVTKLLYPAKNLAASEDHITVFNCLKHLFNNTFIGVKILPHNFKGKREKDIDVLAMKNQNIVAIEVKGWKDIKWSTLNRKLRHANVSLRALRNQYPEIDKTVCIVPNIKISVSWKDKFRQNNNLLIDGEAWNKDIDYNSFCLNNATHCKTKDMRKKLLVENKNKMFKDKEIVFLRNLRKSLNISLRKVCTDIFIDPLNYKNVLATIETGKRQYPNIRDKYRTYLLSKRTYDDSNVKELISTEEKRWKDVFNFPMAIGLASSPTLGEEFERKMESILSKNGFETLRNVIIEDRYLSKSSKNNHHPEADILYKKNGKYIIVSCKDNVNANVNQSVVSIKREIEQISQWMSDIGFSKGIVAVRSNFPLKTWENLELYARENKVELWKFDSNV